MKTGVEWLVEEICTDIEMYDDYGNVTHIEFYNAFKSCTDLSEYIKKAKQIEKKNLYNFYMQGGVDAITEADRNVEQYYNETFKSE
jgi:hypothetical protein